MAAKKKGTPPARPVRTVAFRVTEDEYWGLMLRASESKTTITRILREVLTGSLDSYAQSARRNPKKVQALKDAEVARKREKTIEANTIAAWNGELPSNKSKWD